MADTTTRTGDPDGVRARAAEEMKLTARLARRLGVDTVVGFTGSSIWPYVAMFPPVPEKWPWWESWTHISTTVRRMGKVFMAWLPGVG